MKECLARFHKSTQAAKLRELYPKLQVGKEMLRKNRCPCVKVRDASECDDHLTTAATVNLPKWNRARHAWHLEAKEKGFFSSEIAPMTLKGRKGEEEFATDEHPRLTPIEKMSKVGVRGAVRSAPCQPLAAHPASN